MEISINVDVKFIRDAIQNEAQDYVQRLMDRRKNDCIEAAGDVLNDAGYLPHGTTWEAWNGACYFSVDKGTGADLAHYFHEGIVYGPNFFVKKIGAWRSYRGMTKYPVGFLPQGPGEPAGVTQWTEALVPGSPEFNQGLFNEYMRRCEEILRR